MKIAIIGTGAMGSVYAGVLAEAGHEIWAIDSWADHIEQIKSNGLTLEGASGNRTITNPVSYTHLTLPTTVRV